MWWRSDTNDTGRIEDRVSTVYLEKCRIDRHNQSVTIRDQAGEVRLPAALVACLLLGPGTTITHGAVNLLADAGTTLAWVGENAVRLYAAGSAPSRSSRLLERQARLVTRPAWSAPRISDM